MTTKRATIQIRPADVSDVGALLELEQNGFSGDRFDRPQLRRLVSKAQSTVLVAELGGAVVGGAVMLWRRNLPNGRLYNIVVSSAVRGRGVGGLLLDACEAAARARGCQAVTLEVRTDNKQAITFYENCGYITQQIESEYYSDGSPAFKMRKRLADDFPSRLRLKVPYHGQTLEFTCGAACLIMAFRYHMPHVRFSRQLELQLWKEATTIFMTSGIGGTGPFGLVLAARRRGFACRVVLSARQTPFFSSVRTADKREVIRLMHQDYKSKVLAAGVTVEYFDFGFEDIARELAAGLIPIVLISTWRLHGDRSPHWVVMTGYDNKYVYFHDPYENFYSDQKHLARNVRIPIWEFRRMRRYGRDLYKSVIFVGECNEVAQLAMDGSILDRMRDLK